MKRSKNDHIRSTISRYFKRRQFHETESPSSRKDVGWVQGVTDMSIGRRTRSRTGVENTLALTSITGDATACDQQFTRLKTLILGAVDRYSQELRPLLLPVFAHVYMEMICNGQKVPAHKFHERHCEVFQDEKDAEFMKMLKELETKSDITSNRDVMEFRENRFALNLEEETLEYLMRHLRMDGNMIMLQVFNHYIKVNVKAASESEPNGKIELEALPEVPDVMEDIVNTVAAPPPSVAEGAKEQKSLEEELSDTIQALRKSSPCLPSVCFFTFLNTYQGLCSSTISPDKKKLSGCFEDASISLWSLESDMFKRAPADCDVSQVVLAADHLYRTEDEIQEKMNARCGQSMEVAVLRGHRGPVYKTRFLSNTHSHLLSCSEDCTVRLWDVSTQTNICMYNGHSSPVWDVAVSSTDAWFASSSNDTTSKLWTFSRTFPLRSFIGHTMDVDCVEFHPNNNYLATGSGDKTVRFWSLAEGRTVRLLQGHRGSVMALAFSPNGKLLASAGEDRRIRLWDLGTGHVVKELRGHSDTVYALAFDEHSTLLASGGADCCVRLWDVQKTTDSHQTESHSSPELLGAFPTKSALISYLSISPFNVLLAAGASS